MLSLLLFSTLFNIINACQPDILVDDFLKSQKKYFDGATRYINLLGGDYGTDSASTFSIQTGNKALTFTPKQKENSYFFAKFASFFLYKSVECFF